MFKKINLSSFFNIIDDATQKSISHSAFPNGKKFAFTVVDDTDNATVFNIKPVYDLLHDCGIKTTKLVWVYPPRGSFKGLSLQDEEYLDFIIKLKDQDFEIGLHGVGDGFFTRKEIENGLNKFKEKIGYYPKIHANHSSNPDNLFWQEKRFEWPINLIYKVISKRKAELGGESPISKCFWGDYAKQHIKYIRNLTFNNINTIACDPKMPYRINRNFEYSNLWFSSSDGRSVKEFVELISPASVDLLAKNGGVCIVYTHFASGFVDSAGKLDPQFENNIRYLAEKNGWFVPATVLLDHLANKKSNNDPGYFYRLRTNISWGFHSLAKRWELKCYLYPNLLFGFQLIVVI